MSSLDKDKLSSIFNISTESDNKEDIDMKSISSSDEDEVASEEKVTKEDLSTAYNELNNLIKNGNELFNNVKLIISTNDNPNPDLVNGAAHILDSIKESTKEFTKIYMAQLKHNQTIEIEKMRIEAKKEMLAFKINEAKKLMLLKNKESGEGEGDNIPLQPYCQETVIEGIIKANKRITTAETIETTATEIKK